MLLPLAIGLFVRSRYEDEAIEFRPAIGIISNVSLLILFVATVGENLSGVIDLVGTGGILAGLILIAVAVVCGYLLGVPAGVERRVMSLAAGQRNLAAAFIVANASFADRPTVLIFIAAMGVLMMVILFPLAGEFSRRPRGQHLADPGGAGSARSGT
jgi:BASS family bile acid:Na+ symporter